MLIDTHITIIYQNMLLETSQRKQASSNTHCSASVWRFFQSHSYMHMPYLLSFNSPSNSALTECRYILKYATGIQWMPNFAGVQVQCGFCRNAPESGNPAGGHQFALVFQLNRAIWASVRGVAGDKGWVTYARTGCFGSHSGNRGMFSAKNCI